MFVIALAYTGFIAAMAVKNSRICKAFLLENGFTPEELEGVTTYMVLRYAQMLVLDCDLPAAKAYVHDVKTQSGYFVHSYTNGKKTYELPKFTNAVFNTFAAPGAETKNVEDEETFLRDVRVVRTTASPKVSSNVVSLAKRQEKRGRDASSSRGEKEKVRGA